MKKTDGTVVDLNPEGYVWNGSVRYPDSAIAYYAKSGVTDSNGRVVFSLTKDSGAAIFADIFSFQVAGKALAANQVNQSPLVVVESSTLTSVTVRALVGVGTLLVGNSSLAFAGAGYTLYLNVMGRAA